MDGVLNEIVRQTNRVYQRFSLCETASNSGGEYATCAMGMARVLAGRFKNRNSSARFDQDIAHGRAVTMAALDQNILGPELRESFGGVFDRRIAGGPDSGQR